MTQTVQNSSCERCVYVQHCTKKEVFQRISFVNVTKSAVPRGFGKIYWKKLLIEKFLCSAIYVLNPGEKTLISVF